MQQRTRHPHKSECCHHQDDARYRRGAWLALTLRAGRAMGACGRGEASLGSDQGGLQMPRPGEWFEQDLTVVAVGVALSADDAEKRGLSGESCSFRTALVHGSPTSRTHPLWPRQARPESRMSIASFAFMII